MSDLYAEVTSRIVTLLEQGVVPWRSPILGSGSAGWPRNLSSGKDYRGVNVFLLALTAWTKGYGSSSWVTFRQAKALGGSVREGEKASMVVFWKIYQKADARDQSVSPKTGEPPALVNVPVLRHYHVFNVDQCEGITDPAVPVVEGPAFVPIDQARGIAAGYAGGPEVRHGGGQAFYVPSADLVQIAAPERFIAPEAYYATLFHELAHSTGHRSRLDRGIDTRPAPFGSADYGREELVAEMAAAFLCGRAGIGPAQIENQAAYLKGWLSTLKSDSRLVIAAAGAAQRAADWILGQRPEVGAEVGSATNTPIGP